MPSVAIVVTFFGKVPFWMPAFLHSCRANPDVHWLLYTDAEVQGVPPNVTIKPTTLRELRRRASAAVGTDIRLLRLRKLCDLKVAYGVVFADDLRDFEFWGCSDLDIVWGSVRTFATADRLRDYDVFSSGRHKLSGHCTLYRNTPAMNRLFERIPNHRELLASSHYEHLDERELTKCIRSDTRVFWEDDLTTNGEYQKSLPADARFWWREGRTFDAEGRELMYLHFHKWKEEMVDITFGASDRPTAFSISRRGFLA